MKNIKKFGLGLILIVLLTLFISAKGQLLQAAAQPGFTKNQVQAAKYTFTDNQTVVATIAGKDFKFIASSSSKSTTYYVAGGPDVLGGPSPLYQEFCGLATNSYISLPSTANNPAKGKVSFSYYNTALNKCSPYSANVNVNTTFAGPPISITAPKNGATVKGKVTVSVKALAYVGIAGVQTTVNDTSNTTIFGATSPSYAPPGPKTWSGSGSWDTSNLPDGKYTITTSLIESDGSNKTATATVTANNGNLTGGSTDPSACVFQNGSTLDTSLSWILCPVINGLSESADGINKWVSHELNFSISDNLGPSVHEAWNVFKYLTSGILVIVMLIMVFAQAIGGGPFDAYTVRKMLPRLVAAVILMQVAWYICIWFIELANYTGQGIAGLMAAPFGGTGALELGGLLTRLGTSWATIVGTVGTGGLITAIFFSTTILTWGWPILLLGACMIAIAVVVALTTLLFRNAFIILLVILSPLAILTFVLPGTEKYWKVWRDNFMRLLIFFPLVMAMIYGGRIFAWTAGNLGKAGPLDLLMVLAGFFGPYFFLPKSFTWGGDMLSAAYKGVSESWPIKKGRETAIKELGTQEGGAQWRKQHEMIDKYYKHLSPEDRGNMSRGAALGHRMRNALVKTAGGYPLPTARSRWVMDKETGQWKEGEIGLLEGSMSNDYKEFQRGDPEHGIAPMSVQEAKEAVRDKYYDPSGKKALQNRAFFTWAYNSRSFMEMGEKNWRTGGGNYPDMFKTQGWIDFMHGNPQAYADFSSKLGASSVPYRLPLGGGPAAAHYLPGGKRYNILGYEYEVEQDENGTVKLDANHQPVYRRDARGERIRNIYHNPGLKQIIDRGGKPAQDAAELQADSERFTKLISQSDDPMNVVSQRPEEFKALRNITAELRDIGAKAGVRVESVGALSLKSFIDEESTSFSGRNTLHRLSAGSGEFVDDMLGKGYIEQRMAPQPSDATELGLGRPPAAAGSSTTGAPQAPAPVQSQPARIIPSGEAGQLVVNHEEPRVIQLQPGEAVSPGGVILTSQAQRELNSQFEQLHREFRELKKLGVRNIDEQRRMEEIQNQHPEWQDDEEEGTNR